MRLFFPLSHLYDLKAATTAPCWHQKEGCCVPTVKNWTSPYKKCTRVAHTHVLGKENYRCIRINYPVLLWWRDGPALQSQFGATAAGDERCWAVTSEVRWQADVRRWHHAGGRVPRLDWLSVPSPTAVLPRCPALYSARSVPPPDRHWLSGVVWARDWSERPPVNALRPGAACTEHREAIVAGAVLRAGGGGGGRGGGCAARERRAPSRWSLTEWGDGEGGREEGVAGGGAGAGAPRAEQSPPALCREESPALPAGPARRGAAGAGLGFPACRCPGPGPPERGRRRRGRAGGPFLHLGPAVPLALPVPHCCPCPAAPAACPRRPVPALAALGARRGGRGTALCSSATETARVKEFRERARSPLRLLRHFTAD